MVGGHERNLQKKRKETRIQFWLAYTEVFQYNLMFLKNVQQSTFGTAELC